MARSRNDKEMSAAEFLLQLAHDDEYQRQARDREAISNARESAIRQEMSPIYDDLVRSGIGGRLVELDPSKCRVAAPILLRHLQHPYSPAVIASIARALKAMGSTDGWSQILAAIRAQPADTAAVDTRFSLFCALDLAADTVPSSELLRVASDRSFGGSRSPLVQALKRSSDPRARELLHALVADPDVGDAAERVLHGRPFAL